MLTTYRSFLPRFLCEKSLPLCNNDWPHPPKNKKRWKSNPSRAINEELRVADYLKAG